MGVHNKRKRIEKFIGKVFRDKLLAHNSFSVGAGGPEIKSPVRQQVEEPQSHCHWLATAKTVWTKIQFS